MLCGGGVLLTNVVAGLEVVDAGGTGTVCCLSKCPLLVEEGGGGRIGRTVSCSCNRYRKIKRRIYNIVNEYLFFFAMNIMIVMITFDSFLIDNEKNTVSPFTPILRLR